MNVDGNDAAAAAITTSAASGGGPPDAGAVVRAFADRLRFFKCAADLDASRAQWTPEEVCCWCLSARAHFVPLHCSLEAVCCFAANRSMSTALSPFSRVHAVMEMISKTYRRPNISLIPLTPTRTHAQQEEYGSDADSLLATAFGLVERLAEPPTPSPPPPPSSSSPPPALGPEHAEGGTSPTPGAESTQVSASGEQQKQQPENPLGAPSAVEEQPSLSPLSRARSFAGKQLSKVWVLDAHARAFPYRLCTAFEKCLSCTESFPGKLVRVWLMVPSGLPITRSKRSRKKLDHALSSRFH